MKKMVALARFEFYCTVKRSGFIIYYLVLTGLSVLAVHIMGGTFTTVQVMNDISAVNSPSVIDAFTTVVLLTAAFMIAGITGNGAIRDYRYKSYELMLTFPLSRPQYIAGKFTGLYLASLLLFTAPLTGYASACSFPWINRALVLPFSLNTYAGIYFQRYMVSVFFLGAVFFTAGLSTGGKTTNRFLLVLWYGGYLFIYCYPDFSIPDPLGLYFKHPGGITFLYNRLLWSGIGILLLICVSWRPLYRRIRQSLPSKYVH